MRGKNNKYPNRQYIIMMKRIIMFVSVLVLFSLLSSSYEAKAQDTWWDNLLEFASGIGAPSPQSLSAPDSGSPSTAPAASEVVRTTTSWHFAEWFFNTVTYYAFFAPIEVIRNVVGGIARVFMGV